MVDFKGKSCCNFKRSKRTIERKNILKNQIKTDDYIILLNKYIRKEVLLFFTGAEGIFFAYVKIFGTFPNYRKEKEKENEMTDESVVNKRIQDAFNCGLSSIDRGIEILERISGCEEHVKEMKTYRAFFARSVVASGFVATGGSAPDDLTKGASFYPRPRLPEPAPKEPV